jgi:hypothetical protein
MGLKQISGNTQIIFTIKTFFALIGTMLGLFYGFYQLVVVPKVNATEAHYKEMFDAQKDQNTINNQQLININTSLGTLNGIVETLIKERINNQPVANTGGSFGNNTVSGTPANGNVATNH